MKNKQKSNQPVHEIKDKKKEQKQSSGGVL